MLCSDYLFNTPFRARLIWIVPDDLTARAPGGPKRTKLFEAIEREQAKRSNL
jgi:hypothetical protein